MATRDSYNHNFTANALLAAVTGSASRDGVDVSMKGFEGALFVVNIGTAGDTLSGSVKFDLTLQHADDDGSGSPAAYADCTSDHVIGRTISATGIWATIDADAEAGKTYAVGYRGDKPWVRVQVEKTGSHSTGTPIGAVVIRCHPHDEPVASH